MKLVFVSNLFPSSLEPTRATYNLNLMRGVRALGHEVEVIAPVSWLPGIDRRLRGRQCPPGKETFDGFDVWHPRYLYTPGFWIHKHHLFYRRAISKILPGIVREQKIDGAVLGFLYPDACAAAPLCQRLNLPYVVRVNGSDFRVRIGQSNFSPLIGDVLRQSPGVVCPGQALQAAILAEVPGHPNIRAFNNGVDPQPFSLGTAPRSRRVLFVGNLVDIKGPGRAVGAFAQVARGDAGVGLDVVGDGPLRKTLRASVAALGLAERVVFHGRKSPPEVADLMKKAACLILSSHSEGMPNVVLEALACGTPVVATDVGEVPYLVSDMKTGLVVQNLRQSGNELEAELGKALKLALDRQWNHAEIARSVAGFSWETAAEVVVACLETASP